MILSMTFQCRLFLFSVVLGAAGGFIYTLLTRFNIHGRPGLVKNICDMVFWLMFALIVFLCMLRVNYGEIRPFSILGIGLGMLVYHVLAEEYVRKALAFIFAILAKILGILTEILLTPFKILLFPAKKIIFSIKRLAKSSKV